MTWVSDHCLVSGISNAGGFGVLAAGSFSPQELEAEIRKTQEKTDRPFGVNLIVFHPAIEQLIAVCRKLRVSHIFLGGGMPARKIIEDILDFECHPVGFSPSIAIGKKLIRLGIQALIIEGCEAGGHIGAVSTSVLAQEIIPALAGTVPIFVAGGIATGRAIASYLLMGASGCQLGTRFVCATESRAHPRFKEAFIKAAARDAVISPQIDARFPVIPVRSLRNLAIEDFVQLQKEVISSYDRGEIDLKDAQMKIEIFWAGSLKRAVLDGDIERGSLMAGQSVGMTTCIEPCSDIIGQLMRDADATLRALR